MRAAPLLLLAALLTGCAAIPPAPATGDPQRAYRERLTELAALEDWGISGRVGIRIDGRGWNASLDWRSRPDGYHLNIFGPFGRGLAQIEADTTGVTLTTDDNRVLQASSADALVHQELGWPLPVDGLRDWVLGRPATVGDSPPETVLDAWGRPDRLYQDGWEIHYLRYRGDTCPTMPDRLRLIYGEITVNLVIDEWRLGAP